MLERITTTIEAARRDPVRVAQDPDSDPFVLTLLAKDLTPEVARNPSWRLTLFDGGRFFDTLLNTRSEKGAHSLVWHVFIPHIVQLLRSDVLGPDLGTYLVNHERVEGSVLALTCPSLPHGMRRAAWKKVEANLQTALKTMNYQLRLPGDAKTRRISHLYPSGPGEAGVQFDPPYPTTAINLRWLRLGIGHEDLYLQWAEHALHGLNIARLGKEADLTFKWPDLTPRVARAFRDTILEEGFPGPRGPAKETKVAAINLLRLLLRSPGTPADVLSDVGERVLSTSWFRFDAYAMERDDLLHLIARHPNTPEGFLRTLAEEVPLYVLQNPNLPESWGLPLVEENRSYLHLHSVAIARRATGWLAEWLGRNGMPLAPFLSLHATPQRPVRELSEEHRRQLARTWYLSENISLDLAHDPDDVTREVLAVTTSHPRVQAVLAADQDKRVRHDLTRNTSVSLRILAKLNAQHHGTALGAMASAALERQLPSNFLVPDATPA